MASIRSPQVHTQTKTTTTNLVVTHYGTKLESKQENYY